MTFNTLPVRHLWRSSLCFPIFLKQHVNIKRCTAGSGVFIRASPGIAVLVCTRVQYRGRLHRNRSILSQLNTTRQVLRQCSMQFENCLWQVCSLQKIFYSPAVFTHNRLKWHIMSPNVMMYFARDSNNFNMVSTKYVRQCGESTRR
jgi:hypothetical protein